MHVVEEAEPGVAEPRLRIRAVLEVVAESLEFFGATVRTACNGRLALDAMTDWLPSFILLDLSMPVMDGWETLRQIRRDPRLKDITVIALTAHAMPASCDADGSRSTGQSPTNSIS